MSTGSLRLFGIPESEIASTLRAAEAGGPRARAARDHDLPAPRRDRGRRPATSRRPRTAYETLVRVHPRAPRRHAVLRGRIDGRRAGDHAARGPDRRGRRVVHGRPDVGAADRPRRLVGVLPRRRGGVLERGQDRARRGRRRADRALRRGVDGGRRGARRRRCRALRRRDRDRDHRDRRARTAAPRRSRWARCASRSARATGDGSRARRGCRATAPTSAIARRRSPCTCCAGCSGRG